MWRIERQLSGPYCQILVEVTEGLLTERWLRRAAGSESRHYATEEAPILEFLPDTPPPTGGMYSRHTLFWQHMLPLPFSRSPFCKLSPLFVSNVPQGNLFHQEKAPHGENPAHWVFPFQGHNIEHFLSHSSHSCRPVRGLRGGEAYLWLFSDAAAYLVMCLPQNQAQSLLLQVSFIQIIKAAAPAFTLTLCMLAGLEHFSLLVAASVMMVSFGTGLATVIETGLGSFSWLGFVCIFFSTFLEAVRVVYTQQLLGSLRFNAVEVVVWLGPPTALILFAASAVWEYEGLRDHGFALIGAKPLIYLFAIVLGFGVNLSAALGIQATSSLTFKVVGCVKNTIVVWCGILFLGDKVEGLQMLGYTIALAGFLLYSQMKMSMTKKLHKS